jgi:hypothetical protein
MNGLRIAVGDDVLIPDVTRDVAGHVVDLDRENGESILLTHMPPY